MISLRKEILNISKWTKNYFRKANIKKAVVGISGGIDSAVIAAICVKALGKDNVIGVLLPCETYQEDLNDSINVSKSLGIKYVENNLTRAFNTWWNFYSAEIGNPQVLTGLLDNSDVMVKANAKARFRMLTLYAVAAQAKGLVVGTTNKTEMICGYCTKYGDGGVDIEPIIDFYKTEIFEMGRLLGIDNSIIDKPPSAGLWEGQTDEEELGFSYEDIDQYLICTEHNWGQVIDVKLMNRIDSLYNANLHKDLHLPYYKRRTPCQTLY